MPDSVNLRDVGVGNSSLFLGLSHDVEDDAPHDDQYYQPPIGRYKEE